MKKSLKQSKWSSLSSYILYFAGSIALQIKRRYLTLEQDLVDARVSSTVRHLCMTHMWTKINISRPKYLQPWSIHDHKFFAKSLVCKILQHTVSNPGSTNVDLSSFYVALVCMELNDFTWGTYYHCRLVNERSHAQTAGGLLVSCISAHVCWLCQTCDMFTQILFLPYLTSSIVTIYVCIKSIHCFSSVAAARTRFISQIASMWC